MMPPAVILILMMFIISACEASFLDKPENQDFPLQQAKEYSLQNSPCLKMPSSKPLLKSTPDGGELEPLWEEAKYHEIQFPDKIAKTYEVPLERKNGIEAILLKNPDQSAEPAKMNSSLIVQEFVQGENKSQRQIIATIIGNDSKGNVNSPAFRYMGSRATFSGFMIVSTTAGQIVNIFQYVNGERTTVYLKQDKNKHVTDNYYLGLRLMNSVQTKAAGDGEGTVHGMCHMCGQTTDIYPKYGNICATCLGDTEFLDEIVVTPGDDNDGGGGSNYCDLCGGSCDCLKNGSIICLCTPGENPGTGCTHCHEPGCNGECQNTNVGGDNGSGNNGNYTGGGDQGGDGDYWENNSSTLFSVRWTSDLSFNATFQSVLDTDNALIRNIISNLNNAQTQINLEFSNNIDYIAAGIFSNERAFAGEPYTMKFRPDFTLLNPSVQKIIIFHELLHLNIYAQLNGACDETINTAIPGYQECEDKWGSNINELHHEYFARNYLDYIKSFIQTADPDLDADKAKWGSLLSTKIFEELSSNEQAAIKNYLQDNNL